MRVTTLMLALAVLVSCKQKSAEDEWKDIVKAMPWMMQALENCEAYKNATQMADKTDLASAAGNNARTAEAKNVKAEIEQLVPTGPDQFSLQVAISDKVRFSTHSVSRPIEKGSRVYEQVAKLSVGDCVVFTANNFEPVLTTQNGKVCEFRYYARFLEVKPCP